MGNTGTITLIPGGVVQWQIPNFSSLPVDDGWYSSPLFSCAGEDWCLLICRASPERGRKGERIGLLLRRRAFGGPRTLDVEYTFSARDRNGDTYGKQRNRKEFTRKDDSPLIAIELEDDIMSDLVPNDTLTVLCHLEFIDPTPEAGVSATSNCSYCGGPFDAGSISSHQGKCLDKPIRCPECSDVVLLRNWYDHECHGRSAQGRNARSNCSYCGGPFDAGSISSHQGKCSDQPIRCPDVVLLRDWYQYECHSRNSVQAQFKKELEEKTAEFDSAKRELGNELIELKHQNQELTRKVADIEAIRKKLQSLLTENSSQPNEEIEQKATELESVKRELGNKQLELNKLKRLYEELILKTIDIETSRENLQNLPTSGTQNPIINVTEAYDFAHDFNHFLEEKTDVTFVLETPDGKKEFFAHQFVLARKSSYFADEFREKQRNAEEQVILFENINAKAFRDMIRYCYDWELCLRTTEEACALLEVAFHFKVMSLVNVCQAFLRDAEIEPGNVLKLLLVSRKTEDKGLAERCNRLLQGKTREVIESHELRDVTPSMVRAILDLPMLSLCSEYDLLEWIFEWAKVKSQENNCSVREYLENLLKELNFLALTLEEFVALCKNNQGFFSSAEFQSISMNIASPGTVDMPDWYDKDLRFRAYTVWKPKDNIVLNNKRND